MSRARHFAQRAMALRAPRALCGRFSGAGFACSFVIGCACAAAAHLVFRFPERDHSGATPEKQRGSIGNVEMAIHSHLESVGSDKQRTEKSMSQRGHKRQ